MLVISQSNSKPPRDRRRRSAERRRRGRRRGARIGHMAEEARTAVQHDAPEAPGVELDEEQRADAPWLPERHRSTDVADLRDLLPGVEPDRQVTDWGRSERIEALADRTIVEFYYRYWFRCEVEGVESVPDDGGALI